jgi:SPP1 gp7 family putative phage head morphogenesis protein
MPFRELSPLAKELYLRTQIDELRKLYSATQKSLVAQLRSIDLTDFQMARAQKLLSQVNQIVSALNVNAYKWAKESMPYAYEQGIDLAAERLRALNITRFVAYDAQIHTSAISVLIQDISTELIIANEGMKKFFSRVITQTQQTLLQDKEISRMIAEGLIEGEARRTVSDKILQGLRTQLGEERFLVINGRNYQPSKYAELLARTRTREATSRGTMNTALRYGVDLLQWDSHAEICEYCAQFAGRVYSISGADDNFPQLTEMPPLHPNCRCVIIPITRENLQSRGYMDEIIKLSNSPSTQVDSFSRFEELMATI